MLIRTQPLEGIQFPTEHIQDPCLQLYIGHTRPKRRPIVNKVFKCFNFLGGASILTGAAFLDFKVLV